MFNCYFNSFQYEGGFNSFKMCLLKGFNISNLLVMVISSLEVIFLFIVFFNSFNFWMLLSISFLSLNIFFMILFNIMF